MVAGVLMLVLALPLGDDRGRDAGTAADTVTLRDRSVVRGEIVEPSPRGTMLMIVRREWARTKLPDWWRRWETAEAPVVRQAVAQRKSRLTAWRKERGAKVEPNDPIINWIDCELARLSAPDGPPKSPLMVIKLGQGDVQTRVRNARSSVRMLRQGWLSGFARIETMPSQELRDALEDRGFAARGEGPVSIDGLLPIPQETDRQWIVRRAATEVSIDRGLRFVRAGGAIVPEPAAGQPLDLATAASALSDLKQLLGDAPTDPLADTLRTVAGRGRIGAVVTQLDLSPDLASIGVECTLWVREGADRWSPAGSRNAVIRPDALAPDAGKDLGEDPQVKAVFKLVESIGLGQVPDELKKRSLNAGAATQKALAQVRSASNDDLQALAFPVGEAAAVEAKPIPKP